MDNFPGQNVTATSFVFIYLGSKRPFISIVNTKIVQVSSEGLLPSNH